MADRAGQNGKGITTAEEKGSGEKGYYSPPAAVELPKGGGAIRGIGEKFSVNPVTGTGSLSVPIFTTPGRSDFYPQLSLSYDSGAGNGAFGLGWNLSVPSVTRKTDKGLPRYLDGEDSDVFILSGAEDLVPVLTWDEDSKIWEEEEVPDKIEGLKTYTIRRYRPRIEGLFARIERWQHKETGAIHWRSISKDNIISIYGRSPDLNSQIVDPADDSRVFKWLLEASYDDRGNLIVYEYKSEDAENVDPSAVQEGHRTEQDYQANVYLKRIWYGNRTPYRQATNLPWKNYLDIIRDGDDDWLFQVVFDYGEHGADDSRLDEGNWNGLTPADLSSDIPTPDEVTEQPWPYRPDAFSTYRAGFEVRTQRLCRRVLMFHRMDETGVIGADWHLVRSTDFGYEKDPVATYLVAAKQTGYVRDGMGYRRRWMPPLEMHYDRPDIHRNIQIVDPDSLENLPIGLDGSQYQWVDLDSEGISGILTEQGTGWFYKRNLGEAQFGDAELVATKPSVAVLQSPQQRVMDLAGDGTQDIVLLGTLTGYYQREIDGEWRNFRSFESMPTVDWADPNLRFIDLNGDGHADILIAQDELFVWYPSQARQGFGAAETVRKAQDEEQGPALVFADGTQSVYLADMSGDGLNDLVRIRNGEVCYWPSLGYGRFGVRVTMAGAPWFDHPELFDQKRVRLADIDGSGTTDILYLGREEIAIWLNQAGNGFRKYGSEPGETPLTQFPTVDDLAAVQAIDLLGNGTACLVWSSSLPGQGHQPMRYIDLMGGQKPHLMTSVVNNLGAETKLQYAASTKFYLQDREKGNPWITRLPFPVHVVERVETYDHISRNRFVTRYAYHHGYFDGEEREFRGFSLVEQWDTEELAALSASNGFPIGDNIDAASHVPPVYTKTWFHTGFYLDRKHISNFFAEKEYYREPQHRVPSDADESQRQKIEAQFQAMLLPDTILPPELTAEEEREACRALKGSMLRQEVYALDGTDKAEHPYTVTEQNFTIKCLQPEAGNRYAVFFTHAREAINYHYERSFVIDPTDSEPDPQKKRKIFDPRVAHEMTLEVDGFGNVLKEVAIGYGRLQADASLPLQVDRDKQTKRLITYTENQVTNAITDTVTYPDDTTVTYLDDYRTPLPCETHTYDLTGFVPENFVPENNATRFSFEEWTRNSFALIASATEISYEETADYVSKQKRLIEHVRTFYRKDDLTAFLPLGWIEPLALTGEGYKLAFTPGLLMQVFQRPLDAVQPAGALQPENLLPNPANILGGQGADRGGYVDLDNNGHWWIPSGRGFYSPNGNDMPAQELSYARQHFFLLHRNLDPFGNESKITYDNYDLLIQETRDPLENQVTVGERDIKGDLTTSGNNYRVLQPWLLMDPNRNRSAVAFDALGMVVGTTVMGKPEETLGDSLAGFEADLNESVILDHLADPLGDPHAILQQATTRLVYDLFAYHRTKDDPQPQPAVVYTLARETHDADLETGEQTKIQHSFSYSDGFGREIQQKIQAEPGPLNLDENNAPIIDPRWVGSGWTIFNNKGNPVRQYEPFFSDTHRFEFARMVGVSPILFYDSLERVVATLHPNHTYEKVVFDSWQQETWDVNDTIKVPENPGDSHFNPVDDPDVGAFFRRLPEADYLPTWYEKQTSQMATPAEKSAATKAAAHANTPTVEHFDVLGRIFLSIADNGDKGQYPTRLELDIEGNTRWITDARGNRVMEYAYSMVGPEEEEEEEEGGDENDEEQPDSHLIYQKSMDAGERWMLYSVIDNPICSWNSRGHTIRTTYDELQRPKQLLVKQNDQLEFRRAEETMYGEEMSNPEATNHRGKVWQVYDQAGVVTSEAYDFKGNLLHSARQLTQTYKQAVDWSNSPALEDSIYRSETAYDALNRPIRLLTPHTDTMPANIVRPIYNEANLLEEIHVNLRGASTSTPFVVNIDYDAKGQQVRIEYGNGVHTTYEYDPLTFRLIRLQTHRTSDNARLQDLSYTFDPVGNITHIQDDAQQTIFFNNRVVSPNADYEYDALYHLIRAEGREHVGQTANHPPDHTDIPHSPIPHRNDAQAMRRYVEEYDYDEVGNILRMIHQADNGNWIRRYQYDQDSNRLLSTSLPGDPDKPTYSATPEYSAEYHYDAHGNMVQMPHLPTIQWDFEDQMQQTDLGGGGTVYYVYDASGERVRKVHEHNGSTVEERIYLDGFEIYRKHSGSGLMLERETLHIMDDEKRITLVETKTYDQGMSVSTPTPLTRYQLGNHLDSASLELDETGEVISYEEYRPYGTTAYHAVRSRVEVSAKRYRYTGKERDEETGLYYHGARYYVVWLGRWISTDPKENAESESSGKSYSYAMNNPNKYVDLNGKSGKFSRPPSYTYSKLHSRATTIKYMLRYAWKKATSCAEATAFAIMMWIGKGFIKDLAFLFRVTREKLLKRGHVAETMLYFKRGKSKAIESISIGSEENLLHKNKGVEYLKKLYQKGKKKELFRYLKRLGLDEKRLRLDESRGIFKQATSTGATLEKVKKVPYLGQNTFQKFAERNRENFLYFRVGERHTMGLIYDKSRGVWKVVDFFNSGYQSSWSIRDRGLEKFISKIMNDFARYGHIVIVTAITRKPDIYNMPTLQRQLKYRSTPGLKALRKWGFMAPPGIWGKKLSL